MSGTNGTASAPARKRVLVVGGEENGVPIWAEAAFEIEHVAFGGKAVGKIDPQRADAVVILTDRCATDINLQAHELARTWGVPAFRSPRGWSTAVNEAARLGFAWFVDAVQRGGEAVAEKNKPRAAEAAEIVNNAWKETAEHEVTRAKALEKQLARERTRREETEGTLTRVRSGAAQRIVSEIRRRAAEVRASEHQKLAPVRKAAAKVVLAAKVAQHTIEEAQASVTRALAAVEEAREELNKLLDDERVE